MTPAAAVNTPSSSVVVNEERNTGSCSTVFQWLVVTPKPPAAFVTPKISMTEPTTSVTVGTITASPAKPPQRIVAGQRQRPRSIAGAAASLPVSVAYERPRITRWYQSASTISRITNGTLSAMAGA